jgi:hypothetical protein
MKKELKHTYNQTKATSSKLTFYQNLPMMPMKIMLSKKPQAAIYMKYNASTYTTMTHQQHPPTYLANYHQFHTYNG